jgi:hypothetical protein
MVVAGLQKIDYVKLKEQARKTHRMIKVDSLTAKWRMSDATHTMLIERVIGIAVLPIVGLWAFILAMISLGMALAGILLKAFGTVLRKTRVG